MKVAFESSSAKWAAWLCLFAPSLALAHPGHDAGSTWAAGFFHPLTGTDHLLAMIAVGIWAMHRNGPDKWLAPVAFIAFMLTGALLGASGLVPPYIEFLIAASVALLGLGIVFATRIPMSVGLALIAASAMCHGCAHGVEAADGFGASYLFGMIVATTGLHLFGMAITVLGVRYLGDRTMQWSGLPIAVGGMTLLLSVAGA